VGGGVIGSISAHPVIARQATCHVGWWMGPAARGKGYGTEALRTIFPALHKTGVSRILIGTSPDNTAVRRVLEKLGADEVATSPHRLPNDTTVPSVWYVHTDAGAWHPQSQ
jgi:RimJ/RimL family protein N-acetyltransferase